MYTSLDLIKHSYFKHILADTNITYLLDPLTGVLSRQTFVNYVQDLIKNNTPFCLALIDLDNFKQINDNYGHQIGDELLKAVSNDLSEFIGSDGIVGRFGGDEFVYVHLKDIDYSSNHQFLSEMYAKVFRKNVHLSNCNPFITGTTGTCSFPIDAQTYDGLFSFADKTLYRGKVKGRNCYIIYVESKHKNITVQNLAKEDLYTMMYTLSHEFELATNLKDKLNATYLILQSLMMIDQLLFVDKTGALHDCNNWHMIGFVPRLKTILGDTALITSNYSSDDETLDGMIHNELSQLPLQSLMITRVNINNHFYGYILCTDGRNSRIWQPDEKALLFYVAKCLAAFIDSQHS